jgi:hypothetical protein
MSDQDIASKRRSRLKELRSNMAADEDGSEQEFDQSMARSRRRRASTADGGALRGRGKGGGGFGGGARRTGGRTGGELGGGATRRGSVGGDFRARVLTSLRDISEGDELIEGTDIGRKNLENLVDALERAESTGLGGKLGEIVLGMLAPAETDDGLEFSPEGVAKLVSFLEQSPGVGQRPGVGGRPLGRPGGRGPRGGRHN